MRTPTYVPELPVRRVIRSAGSLSRKQTTEIPIEVIEKAANGGDVGMRDGRGEMGRYGRRHFGEIGRSAREGRGCGGGGWRQRTVWKEVRPIC